MGRQGGGDLAADAAGELASPAVGGYADLEGSIGISREEGEGAEVGSVDNVDGYTIALA